MYLVINYEKNLRLRGDTEREKHVVFSWNSQKVGYIQQKVRWLEKEFQAGCFIWSIRSDIFICITIYYIVSPDLSVSGFVRFFGILFLWLGVKTTFPLYPHSFGLTIWCFCCIMSYADEWCPQICSVKTTPTGLALGVSITCQKSKVVCKLPKHIRGSIFISLTQIFCELEYCLILP